MNYGANKPVTLRTFVVGFIVLIATSAGQVIATDVYNHFFRKKPPEFTWTTQKFEELEFVSPQIMSPEKVSLEKAPVEQRELIRSSDSLRASDQTSTMIVSVIEFKEGVTIDAGKATDGSMDFSAKAMRPISPPNFSKIPYEKNGIIGYRGAYDAKIKGAQMHFRSLIFVRKLKLYNVSIIWVGDRATETDAERFLTSFKFLEKPVQAQNLAPVEQ